MSAFKDLTGKKHNRLTAVCRVESNKHGQGMWKCICDCGNEVVVNCAHLSSGHTKSCGCLYRETRKQGSTTHGMHYTSECAMLNSARARAKKKQIIFSIDLNDIVIPEFCPVFTDMRLNKNNKKQGLDSPTLDRLIPSLGYVKGNIRVISWKANHIKSFASLEDITKVYEWLKKELYAGSE